MDKRKFLKRVGLLPLAMLPSVEAKAQEQPQPTVINNITVHQHGSLVRDAQLHNSLLEELTHLKRTGRLSL